MSRLSTIWGRNRPVAEDCACLNISLLKDIGGLACSAQGVYERDGSRLAYCMDESGTLLSLSYVYQGVPVQQCISIVIMPVQLKNVATRKYFLCPICEKKCCKLYVSNKRYEMACVKCGNLCYELQVHHNHNIYYRFMRAEKAEKIYYEKWQRRYAKRHRKNK